MPLATVDAAEQHLCALHLSLTPVLTDALEGRCALYLVMEPEQAIAAITLMGRLWQLADVRCARNRAATTVAHRLKLEAELVVLTCSSNDVRNHAVPA